jgi:hypothetical protein
VREVAHCDEATAAITVARRRNGPAVLPRDCSGVRAAYTRRARRLEKISGTGTYGAEHVSEIREFGRLLQHAPCCIFQCPAPEMHCSHLGFESGQTVFCRQIFKMIATQPWAILAEVAFVVLRNSRCQTQLAKR